MSKRVAAREYGLFFGSGNYVAGVQRDQFPTLAEANEAARLLAEPLASLRQCHRAFVLCVVDADHSSPPHRSFVGGTLVNGDGGSVAIIAFRIDALLGAHNSPNAFFLRRNDDARKDIFVD